MEIDQRIKLVVQTLSMRDLINIFAEETGEKVKLPPVMTMEDVVGMHGIGYPGTDTLDLIVKFLSRPRVSEFRVSIRAITFFINNKFP